MKRVFQGRSWTAAVIAFGSLIFERSLIVGIVVSQSEKGPAVVSKDQHDIAETPDDLPNKNSAFTADQIRDALLESAAKLVDLKIVVVEKGNFNELTPDTPVPVVFKEMWMHSASAQVRMDWRADGNGEEWWTGFESIEGPLTADHLASTPGVKECVDMSRYLVFADSRLLRPGPGGEIRTLHSVSKSPQFISNLFVPLVELNAPWIPNNRLGGSPVVNAITRLPLSAWRLLGDDKLGGEDVIRAEICKQDTVKIPLKRHEGELALTPVYLVWFAKNYGLMPLRIEDSVRYGFQGRDFCLERRPDGKSSLVYEASDFMRFKDVWVPRVGRQCAYRPNEQNSTGFDPDGLAETLLSEGTMRRTGDLKLGYSYEWKVLDIENIDPSMDLWFEPQPGAEVFNTETHKRYVQADVIASAKFAAREQAIEALVGKSAPEFPEGATWLNGQPLTWKALRGKVVILDFWSDSCGACRNDLPRLNRLHNDRQTNGLTIIGVHLSGSELADVKKAVNDLHLDYSICIDIPIRREMDVNEETLFPSEFSSHFAVGSIPHFVVVDRRGIVAASLANRFEDALVIAERLTKEVD